MESVPSESPYELLLKAATLIPFTHYLLGFLTISVLFLYNFLEMHFFQDLFTGFSGQPVTLTFSPSSQLYQDVVSKCEILHGRYLSTPWLCSPHLQTTFIHFFGNAPVVNYRRQIFVTSDGGTIALDWVVNTQVNGTMGHDDRNPIMIIIPGLTSASDSAYIKHLAFRMAKHGWKVVVSNHRGLGGVSLTSDCSYSGGWTEDARTVIDHLHCEYPEAPLFAVGTSIGANILVKYLGEDGINVPLIGAAAICSPWDLLICDRFISRRLVQKFYNKALAFGLKEYAYLHEAVISRLSNWEGVKKSRTVREFDDSATRILGKFETVDTYYRRCSSSIFIGSVKVPILCVSSLDDPVCSSEAIPWDECRLNDNVILAATEHGGHLPFFEGLTASSVWWVRAVEEFLITLQSSPLSVPNKEMPVSHASTLPLESSIDHAPYVRVSEDGFITAVNDEVAEVVVQHQEHKDEHKVEESTYREGRGQENPSGEIESTLAPEKDSSKTVSSVEKRLYQLSKHNRKSMWLLAYIAIFTTWPLVGPALTLFLRRRFATFFTKKLVSRLG